MKALITATAALLLATSSHASNCASARANTTSLMNDLIAAGQAIMRLDTSTATEAEMNRAIRALERRVNSTRDSLISVNVYCHGNASALKWANEIADKLDTLDVGP